MASMMAEVAIQERGWHAAWGVLQFFYYTYCKWFTVVSNLDN
jgi:hypothetical protein